MADTDTLRITYLIKRAEMLVRSKLEAGLQDLDITVGQYAVLSLLGIMPDASSAQLARSVGVTPQTMAETIATFERADLISRTQSGTHKRILNISMTPKGRALLKECEARVSQVEDELFAGLASPELAQLRGLLTRLHANEDLSGA